MLAHSKVRGADLNLHSNTNTGGDTCQDRQKDADGDVLEKLAPVVLVVGAGARRPVMVRTLPIDFDIFLAGSMAMMHMLSTALMEALPSLVPATLNAAPHISAIGLLGVLHANIANENLAGGSLDELDGDRRDAFDETAADLDDVKADIDDLQVLLLIERLGPDSKAVSQQLLLLLAVAFDYRGRQITVPRVGAGV